MEFEAARGMVISCAGLSPDVSALELQEIETLTANKDLVRCTAKTRTAGTLDDILYSVPGHQEFTESARVTMTSVLYYRPWAAPGDSVLHEFGTQCNHYTVMYEPTCGKFFDIDIRTFFGLICKMNFIIII